MKWNGRTRRGAFLLIAALLVSLAIAACGGSSNSNKTTASRNTASTTTTQARGATTRTAFASCLKQHGVTLPAGRGRFGFRGTRTTPSAGTSTNGITITTPSGSAPGGTPPSGNRGGFPGGTHPYPGGGGFAAGNSKFAKAFQACRSKLGSSGFGPGPLGGGTGTRRFTPHFSTATLKSYVSCIRKNGYPAMPEPKASGHGSFFPASVEKKAKFQAANRTCQSILFKAFRGTAPGAPGTTSTTTSTTSNA